MLKCLMNFCICRRGFGTEGIKKERLCDPDVSNPDWSCCIPNRKKGASILCGYHAEMATKERLGSL